MSKLRDRSHFRRGERLEVLALALELMQEQTTVEFDVRLPDVITGDMRQCDIVVRSWAGNRGFVRIVEVQDRAKPVGPAFVDTVITKTQRLGAHRATIISRAGFTNAAIARIKSQSALIDALVVSRGGGLPPVVCHHEMMLEFSTGTTASARLQPLRFTQPIALHQQWEFVVSESEVFGVPVVCCFHVPSQALPVWGFTSFAADGSIYPKSLALEVADPDGQRELQFRLGPSAGALQWRGPTHQNSATVLFGRDD